MNIRSRSQAPSFDRQVREYQSWTARIDDLHEILTLQKVPAPAVQGTHVLVTTKFGLDAAVLLSPCEPADADETETGEYVRDLGAEEIRAVERLAAKAAEAATTFGERIAVHGLPMKPVGAHYLFNEEKLLLYFTADDRVDFRELVRDLVSIFHLRIELRQIGAREESRMVGGMGICGRCLCCNVIGAKLPQVSIKMAKSQNLPIASNKISGPCGRLLCCLSFEQEAYASERSKLPVEGDKILCEGQTFRVVEVSPVGRYLVAVNPEEGRMRIAACRLQRCDSPGSWVLLDNGECCGRAGDDPGSYPLQQFGI